jgi:hypothetical protein
VTREEDVSGEPGVYEVRVPGCASVEEAIALQEPVASLLCPDPEHTGPCEIPWSLTLRDGDGDGDGGTVLVVGVLTTAERAAGVAERVSAALGRPTEVAEGDPAEFEDIVEQDRVERGRT